MAQPITVSVTGAITAAPAAASGPAASLQATKMFGLQRTYSYRQDNNFSINAPVTPFDVPLGSITKVRFLALSVIGASVTVLVTSGAGTNQAFNVSEFMLFSAPSAGDELTDLKLLGVSDVEMVLLGD